MGLSVRPYITSQPMIACSRCFLYANILFRDSTIHEHDRSVQFLYSFFTSTGRLHCLSVIEKYDMSFVRSKFHAVLPF